MQIDSELVQKLAKLSGLRIDPSKEDSIREDLQKMLDFVERLNEIDTSGIAPLQHMMVREDAERKDETETGFTRHQALFNAQGADEQYFRVPKVIKK